MRSPPTLSPDAVNRMPRGAFIDAFGTVYRDSPWVAERVLAQRPFCGLDALAGAMQAVVTGAPREAQLALIRAHPELVGREAAAGRLAARSSDEDARLRLDRLSRAEFGRLARLNRRYRERHHFPCIIALRLHRSRDTVYAEFERRIGNDTEREITLALEQIGQIARGRLEDLVCAS